MLSQDQIDILTKFLLTKGGCRMNCPHYVARHKPCTCGFVEVRNIVQQDTGGYHVRNLRTNIIQTEDGLQVFSGNTLAGYVENEVLFGIGPDGYAHVICTVNHASEILGKLTEWQTLTNAQRKHEMQQLNLQNQQSHLPS